MGNKLKIERLRKIDRMNDGGWERKFSLLHSDKNTRSQQQQVSKTIDDMRARDIVVERLYNIYTVYIDDDDDDNEDDR